MCYSIYCSDFPNFHFSIIENSKMNVLLIVLLSVSGSTVLGMLLGLLVRAIPHRLNDIIMGAAAGVMLGAAMFELIEPAFSQPCNMLSAIAGTFVGAAIISMLDRIVPHLHRLVGLDSEAHRNNKSIGKVLLFVTAIALHNIPEGLAAGVSFGTGNLGGVLTVAGALSIQNVPESLVIVAPLFAIGVSIPRTLIIAVGIALVTAVSILTGYGLISVFSAFLPFFLAMAGGAMLYIISDEMIPETHSHGYEKQATFALLIGVLAFLILQHLIDVEIV